MFGFLNKIFLISIFELNCIPMLDHVHSCDSTHFVFHSCDSVRLVVRQAWARWANRWIFVLCDHILIYSCYFVHDVRSWEFITDGIVHGIIRQDVWVNIIVGVGDGYPIPM